MKRLRSALLLTAALILGGCGQQVREEGPIDAHGESGFVSGGQTGGETYVNSDIDLTRNLSPIEGMTITAITPDVEGLEVVDTAIATHAPGRGIMGALGGYAQTGELPQGYERLHSLRDAPYVQSEVDLIPQVIITYRVPKGEGRYRQRAYTIDYLIDGVEYRMTVPRRGLICSSQECEWTPADDLWARSQ